jgi:KaiC/GvpD/RAD55 family RecA-like ATPase
MQPEAPMAIPLPREPAAETARKAPTRLERFDEITHGGLPAGRSSLLLGGPGSGKTIFAMQFLAQGARVYSEQGVLVASEESTERLDAKSARTADALRHTQLDASEAQIALRKEALQARSNLRAFCLAQRAGRHPIEVIDVLNQPDRALGEGIFTTATSSRLLPPRVRRMVGSLGDTDAVRHALSLDSDDDATA